MSLLDDVSIVVTPNGYKAGTLFGVIPVPTEGAEEITNGDFATDTDWTKETGWTISGGSANCLSASGKSIYQTNTLIAGRQYKLNFTVSNHSSGFLGSLGNDFGGVMAEANGTYEIIGTATGTAFGFVASGSFTGSVDNVSVKEYTSADMDVTRATAATRVDENGLVNYAEVIGSEEVTDGNFPTPNTEWTAFGLATINENIVNFVDAGSNTYSGITQDINSFSAKQYRVEITVTNWISGNILATFSSNNASFNITGNGTYSVYLTPVSNGDDIGLVRDYSSGADFSYSITNVSVKEAARDNVPRIDYTGGGCPHILAEPQRTNLLPYSEDFSESAWTKTRCTIDSGGHTSPSGESNAFKMTATDDDARLQDGSEAAGVVYTQSIYVKSATGSDVSGQVDFTGTQIQTFTATSEWQRVDTTSDDTRAGVVRVRITNSGDELYIWGAQLEVGSYATSYIPTSGSTVTRNQDIFTRDGIGSLINSEEGVFFVEMAALANDGTNKRISLSNGTNSYRVVISYSTSNNIQIFIVGAPAGTFAPSKSIDITLNSKIAVSWSSTEARFYVDGSPILVTLGNFSYTASTLSELKTEDGAGGSDFYGKVKQLQVYKTALTDTQLAALTS